MAIEQTPELERALQAAADRKASDLFLLPDEPVSFRVKDRIVRTEGDALTEADVRAIATAAVGQERLATLGEAGTIVTSCSLPGVIDGQMTVASSRGQLTVVVRLITVKTFPVDFIRVPPPVLAAIERGGGGLAIFTGRVGSGKTTTMLSVLDHLNATAEKHICTVEDPIEVRLTPKRSLVTQREVGLDVPDFVGGIVASLRQDADVILVGELRTPEAVQACVTAASVGRMVITQLHATTPEKAIQRLYDVQPPDQLPVFRRHLSETLRMICAQVLLPKAPGEGRVPAYGVLIPDAETRAAILAGRDVSLRQKPAPDGSLAIVEDIERLRREGQITDEAARAALQSLE
jgi:twitching motility protein PilT